MIKQEAEKAQVLQGEAPIGKVEAQGEMMGRVEGAQPTQPRSMWNPDACVLKHCAEARAEIVSSFLVLKLKAQEWLQQPFFASRTKSLMKSMF